MTPKTSLGSWHSAQEVPLFLVVEFVISLRVTVAVEAVGNASGLGCQSKPVACM